MAARLKSCVLLGITLLASVLCVTAWASERDKTLPPAVARRVMAFYYPWYGVPDGPGGAGKSVHWGRIDPENKDISESTNYPAIGAYDSHDPKLIDRHCRQAKEANIDTLIVSWWGHRSYSDRAMEKILDGCEQHGLKACIYYETVPQPLRPETAAKDIIRAMQEHAGHKAYLKIEGRPVVFVYGRAVNQLGLADWRTALQTVNKPFRQGVIAIGDQFSYGSARVFDGVHTYNTAGSLGGMSPNQAEAWAARTYPTWVKLADSAARVCAITVIPGYDDTKIRKPGLAVPRTDGALYQKQWEQAIEADPHWVLITSFNEWHEGSEIEPSVEHGGKYLEMTGRFAARFKQAGPRALKRISQAGLSEQLKASLKAKLDTVETAALPGAESMAFWWLLDVGVDVQSLTWDQVVDGTLERYAAVLYCAGEQFRRSVREGSDVDDALQRYLKRGGLILFLPSLPWPLYYDENGRALNRSNELGLTLSPGWERPPKEGKLQFTQVQSRLPHVPQRFAFPSSGDLRWRPFVADKTTRHFSMLDLQDENGRSLGNGVVYAAPQTGGGIIYVWFGLLNGPHAEPILYDVFELVADRMSEQNREARR